MNDHRITPHNFDRTLRETLRYRHGFSHEDLERTKSIVSDAIAHIEKKAGTSRGLGAQHLDMAMKFLREDHPDWKRLSENKQKHIEMALRDHLGETEPA